MDSLRYWVTEMHVDGFRFDLASTLAREFYDVDRLSALLRPHPAGPGRLAGQAHRRAVGRRRGRLPGRQLPARCGPSGTASTATPSATSGGARARRSASSPPGSPARRDLYESDGRKPYASINFVTAHDGFTLHDLVSYNDKHNEANGEDNRDGESNNRSWNCGVEGPTDDPDIVALREQQKRNFLATLLLSQGVPMLLARRRDGPHPARQQQRLLPGQRDLLGRLERRAGELDPAATSPAGCRRCAASTRSSTGGASSRAAPVAGSGGLDDIVWFNPDGEEMSDEDWDAGWARSLGVFLNGDGHPRPGPRGATGSRDDSFLLLFNAHDEPVDFTLPASEYGEAWEIAVNTAAPLAVARARTSGSSRGDDASQVEARSIVVLRRQY